MRTPSDVTSWAVLSLLPMNRLSTMYCISTSFRKTWPPQYFSNCRWRGPSVSTLAYRLYCLLHSVLAGSRFSKFCTSQAPSNRLAQIAGQCRQPATAGQAARVAHRHVARPVRQRRAGHDDRPEQFGPDGGCHQDLPACLAIADDCRLAAAVGVQLADLAHEGRFGSHDVLDGLTGNGIGQKANEVAGMPCLEGCPDLAVGFEAADARAVARAWIDHHKRSLARIARRVGWRQDAYEAIVDRPRKVQPGHDDLRDEVEYVRRLLLQMRL